MLNIVLFISPILLDGAIIHVTDRIEVHFNLFYDSKRGGRDKSLASPIWVTENGTWVDDHSASLDDMDIAGMFSDCKVLRVRLIFRDKGRSLLVAFCHLYHLFSIIGWDKRATIIYIDMLPFADQP